MLYDILNYEKVHILVLQNTHIIESSNELHFFSFSIYFTPQSIFFPCIWKNSTKSQLFCFLITIYTLSSTYFQLLCKLYYKWMQHEATIFFTEKFRKKEQQSNCDKEYV